MMVQVPGSNIVTVVPETVHTVPVELANVTVVPAESEAVSVNVPVPPVVQVSDAGGFQLMVWDAALIVIFSANPVVAR